VLAGRSLMGASIAESGNVLRHLLAGYTLGAGVLAVVVAAARARRRPLSWERPAAIAVCAGGAMMAAFNFSNLRWAGLALSLVMVAAAVRTATVADALPRRATAKQPPPRVATHA
jgi:hypothetical protein